MKLFIWYFILFNAIFLKAFSIQTDLNSLIQKWNYIQYIQGQFQQNHTLLSYIQCNPCKYSIIIYGDYLQIIVSNKQQNKFKGYQLDIQHDSVSIMNFDAKTTRVISKNQQKLQQKIMRFSRNGLHWKYQFTLPVQGLIIKGSYLQNQYIVPIISLISGIFWFFYFQITRAKGRSMIIESSKRSSLISLIILSQTQHIIIVILLTIGIKYTIWQDLFLVKVIWYIIFMVPLSFTIIQILSTYESIKIVYYNIFKNHENSKLKDFGLLLIIFIGVYFGLIIILYITKKIYVFYYFSIFFIQQFLNSLIRKRSTYQNLHIYFFICISYLIFLANHLPLYCFQQHSRKQITIFYLYLILIIFLGNRMEKIFIKKVQLNQTGFQTFNQLQLSRKSQSKGTLQDFKQLEHHH